MSNASQLTLVIAISYLCNGVPLKKLKACLRSLVSVGIGEGMLTGSSAATVDTYDIAITDGAPTPAVDGEPESTPVVLTLVVDYDLAGETLDTMALNLEYMVNRGIGSGLLTSFTEAEIDTHNVTITRT